MICYACGKGKLTQSGCHNYCDNCNFTIFVMTPDYISSAAAIVGTLVSNTEFKDPEGFVETVQAMIELHLPVMHTSMTQHIDPKALPKFFKAFLDEVKIHSINLIGPVNMNIFEPDYNKESAAAPAEIANTCVLCSQVNTIVPVDALVASCVNCHKGYRIIDGGFIPL